MMKKKPMQFILIVFTIITIGFIGCEEKKASRGENETTKVESQPPIVSNKDTLMELTKDSVVVVIPSVIGKWTGKLNSRPTVLNITSQKDSSFSGKISINYREAIHQDISGTISPTSMNMKMNDLLHSRYQGKYSGKLSSDGNTYSGTFTMDLDGSKSSFSLTKKQ